MGQPLAIQPQVGYALTVLNGTERGATYQLMGVEVSIGRNEDNNIIIKDDPKISRNHALIKISQLGVEIKNISGHNKLFVGGDETNTAILKPGDIIQLGNTKFQFKALSSESDKNLMFRIAERSADKLKSLKNSKLRRPNYNQQNKTTFYVILAGVVIFGAWLMTTEDAQKKPVNMRSEEDINMAINSNQKIVEATAAEKARLRLNSREYEEAQPNFIKGFRDYRKGQFDRAKESFEACLSLFPTHIQCQRYLRLADKKLSELIQYHMVLANKYRAQNQFSACRASYKNVMVMVKNPTDKIYIEAKSGHDACQALEGDRF